MHWLSPCADTEDCTDPPPRPLLAVVCSRDTFQLISSAITQIIPVQMMICLTGFLPPAAALPPAVVSFTLLLFESSASAVANDGMLSTPFYAACAAGCVSKALVCYFLQWEGGTTSGPRS
jgi:hypothetical protein